MRIGVCYYPEQWDRERWAADAAAMKDLGVEVVRIGEFAWAKIEPERGVFDWRWYDDAVETLSSAGLKLIIGTPTATPPKWLVDARPEILAVDEDGRPRKFGSRRHYCFSSPVYHAESERIVSIVAKRFGGHDAVIGWQTDNEFGCHDTVRSYSPMARDAFRRWLAARYGNIDALNDAWGTVFWSQTYRGFDEIDLPNLTVTEPNPSHVLDFFRFSSDQVVAYNKMQADCIRARSPGRDIYHNFMGFFPDFDHFRVGDDIDVAGWDSYPLGFLDIGPFDEEYKKQFMRQGHPDFAGFHHDLYRGCGRGRLAVLEQQPGPVNWAQHNPAPLSGMVNLWTLEAAAHGAELLCYFRWRQAPFAQEQMHAGLLRPDHTPAEGYNEAKLAISELRGISNERREGRGSVKPPTVALVYSYETQWMSEIQPQGAAWNYWRIVLQWYGAARRFGFNVDIVEPGAPLTGYALILAPALFHVSDVALAAFKAADAPIIFGPRSGSKTQTMQLPSNLAPGPLQELLPLKIGHSESFASFHREEGDFEDNDVSCSVWLDHVETALGPIAASTDGAGLLYRQEDYWLFTACPDEKFLTCVMTKILRDRHTPVCELPEELRKRESDGRAFIFNYGARAQNLPAGIGIADDKRSHDDQEIGPAGVIHWRK